MSSDAKLSIMTRLRIETATLHDLAEDQPFQKALVAGTLPRTAYVEHLGQLYMIHNQLETQLRDLAKAEVRLRPLIEVALSKAPLLEADLTWFGREPGSIPAKPATQYFLDRLASLKERGAALIGPLYVMEGSTNGGRFIAAAVRRAYQLKECGATYFDPYGDQQRQRWRRFKETCDGTAFSDGEKEAVISEAKAAFAALTEMACESAQVSAASTEWLANPADRGELESPHPGSVHAVSYRPY